MHSQVFLGNIARNGHRIEYFHEQVINLNIEALQDFVPESERLSHIP